MKTFVVRIYEDDGSDPAGEDTPRLRGVVDEVATGLRTTFRSELELVAGLKAAMGTVHPGPSGNGGGQAPGGSASG